MIRKIISFSFLSTSALFFSQEKAEQALKLFEEQYPQEKIHLLFDKKSYVAGDNIWFKSFVFTGYIPSMVSTNLFVELYDSNKTLLDKKFIPLVNGEANGNFVLPESLKENIYFVRAYTTWSTNFSEEFQPIRPIEIFNPSSSEKLVINNTADWNVTLHPEGGTFIDGISSKFSVRMHSKGEKPALWNGYITEASKPESKLTTFKNYDENVGSFTLTPESGKEYQLTVEDEKGIKHILDLPTVNSSGIHLKVESTDDAVKYAVTPKNLSSESEFYTMIGTINSQIVYKAKLNKLSGKTHSIPADKLVNGILLLSLFDAKENLISQRMCFVQPSKLSIKKPEISAISLNSNLRSLNSFTISDKIDNSAFSVMVLDGDSKSSEDDNSLISSILLTSDIPSDISSPARYFKKNSNSEALDAILMSEKWKRYDWKTLISGVYPTIRNKANPYISYKGKVTVSGKPATNTELNLLFPAPNNGTKYHSTKTDANGFFSLTGLMFEDSIKFSYQLNDPKIPKKDVQVIFQPDYAFIPLRASIPSTPYILKPRTSDDKIPAEVVKYIEAKKSYSNIGEKVTMIKEVEIKAKKQDLTKKLNQELSSPLFRNANETVFDFVNDNVGVSYMNILQFLQGRVAGLQIDIQGLNARATFRGSAVSIFLDEMPVSASQISSIPASDVAMIKVFRGFFAGGTGGNTNGGIAIYTKRGGISGSAYDTTRASMLKQSTLKGYDKEIAYTNPDYNNESFKSIEKDTRTVLFWNPFVKTQPKEPLKIEFYNNDDAKSYRIIVIGYDSENLLPLYYDETLKP